MWLIPLLMLWTLLHRHVECRRAQTPCHIIDEHCHDIEAAQIAVDGSARSRVRLSSCSSVRIDQTWLARSGGFDPISLPLSRGWRRGVLLDGIASLSFMIGLLVGETDQSGSFWRNALIARQP
jgi:hypothetical protein